MRKIILTLVFFITIVVNCFSQIRLLDYDFNKGGYYLLGARSESDRNEFAEKLGDFYTSDTILLNQIKKEWVFKKPSPQYACGYHYIIYICKNGKKLESICINLNCSEIVSDKGYFYFHTDKLQKFAPKFKSAYEQSVSFSSDSLSYARDYRLKILSDSNVIMVPSPEWVSYAGSFTFDYSCKECLGKEQKYLETLTDEIKNAYSGENFKVDLRGGSLDDIFIEVICNKSLFDKFNLYKLDPRFNKWEPFYINLYSYWKNPQ